MSCKLIRLTKEELDKLPEYSCSVPTLGGIRDGKVVGVTRWKRDQNAYSHTSNTEPKWCLGEYIPDEEPGYMKIKWTEIEIFIPNFKKKS